LTGSPLTSEKSSLSIVSMKFIIQLLVLFGLSTSLIGCQSALKASRKSGEGHFRARALIKDKSKAKSFIVNLSFNVQKSQALRLDATSPLNQHLASFLITPKELSYFIVNEKVYYQGKPSAQSFARFMAVPLEPSWLENILFREPFESKDWSCTKENSGELESCVNLREKLNIKWSIGNDKKLIVDIDHPKGQIQMNFHRIQPKVESGVNMSQLKTPKDFKKLR